MMMQCLMNPNSQESFSNHSQKAWQIEKLILVGSKNPEKNKSTEPIAIKRNHNEQEGARDQCCKPQSQNMTHRLVYLAHE